MDAIDLLIQQHRDVNDLFERCLRADGEGRREAFDQLADMLAIHTTIEERHFYPMVKNDENEDRLLESVQEHLSMKRLLADMLEANVSDDEFTAQLNVLKEQVQHHVKEEEGSLFPEVRRRLDADRLAMIEQEMAETMSELDEEGEPRRNIPDETEAAPPI